MKLYKFVALISRNLETRKSINDKKSKSRTIREKVKIANIKMSAKRIYTKYYFLPLRYFSRTIRNRKTRRRYPPRRFGCGKVPYALRNSWPPSSTKLEPCIPLTT